MRTKKTILAASIAATVLMGSSISGEIIYDNSSGTLDTITGDTPASGTSYQIGDAVTFAGSARTLTDWSFEYNVAGSGNETLHAFLYNISGGFPGSILWDSGVVTATPGSHTFNAPGLSLGVPESLAWGVEFGGIEAGETSGLFMLDGPTVGTSPNFDATAGTIVAPPAGQDFYYLMGPTGWQAVGTPGVDNLAARFTAVPEPSTLALITGGLGLFGFLARRRKA
jgi:hypothetical protein